MLTKRIIACLDVDAGRVVKGTQFLDLRDAGDPAALAAAHGAAGADEVVLLDITATHEKRNTLLETVRRTARELFVPFTVGGGVRTLDDASAIFDAGADKISINSAAIADAELITCIAQRFGSQAVIVAIDAKRNGADSTAGSEDGFQAFVSGGRVATGRDAISWAQEAEDRGAGEILLTSMDRDGTGVGFDCDLTRSDRTSRPHSGDCLRWRRRRGTLCPGFPRRRGGCGPGRVHFSLWPKLDLGIEEALAGGRNSREVAVLIPSIDLMGGKIVQLVQGDKKALEFDNFDEWIARFSSFPLVQLIDLDAAMGREAERRI